MKKRYIYSFVLFLSLLVLPDVQAQFVARWQVPPVTGLTLHTVRFADNSTVLAAGEGGTIVRSTDAGKTWTNIASPTKRTLRSLYFLDANTGFAAGDSILLKTTDGGITWVKAVNGVHEVLSKITFVNSTRGFLAGSKGIYRTTDMGNTWARVDTHSVISVSFANQSTGYAISRNGLVLKTTNGGSSWTQASTIPSLISSLFFTTPDTGYAGTPGGGRAVGGSLYRTTNGGSTWTKITTFYIGADDIYFKDKNNGFIVGLSFLYRGEIYKTTDAGATWTQQTVTGRTNNTTVALTSIHFNSAGTNGAAAGYGGTLLASSDSGTTWKEINVPLTLGPDDSRQPDITTLALNGNRIFAGYEASCGLCVTQYGYYIGSKDLGWQQTKTSRSIEKVQFTDLNTGYSIQNATLYKSVDGGQTWTEVTSLAGKIGLEYSLAFINSSAGFVGGDTGRIAKTTNGGASWNVTTVPDAGIVYDIEFSGQFTGAAATENKLLVTTNGGNTWQDITPFNWLTYYKARFFNGGQTGYFIAASKPYSKMHLYKTTDGGLSWLRIEFDGEEINDFDFASANYGFAITEGRNVYATTDGWQTKSKIFKLPETEYFTFTELAVKDRTTLYLGTSHGSILKLINLNPDQQRDAAATLFGTDNADANAVLVSPNPTSGRFTIQFAEADNVQIKISDSFGREVRSYTANGSSAEVELDGALPGIYYVNVYANGEHKSGKVVVK